MGLLSRISVYQRAKQVHRFATKIAAVLTNPAALLQGRWAIGSPAAADAQPGQESPTP